jgi:hypothetical protein
MLLVKEHLVSESRKKGNTDVGTRRIGRNNVVSDNGSICLHLLMSFSFILSLTLVGVYNNLTFPYT